MSRFVAIAAAISLVVCGAVIGGLGTYLVLDRPGRHDGFRPPPPPRPPAPFTREMESRLDLSEDQREKIHEILTKSRDEADAIRRELRPRLEAELAATRASIAGSSSIHVLKPIGTENAPSVSSWKAPLGRRRTGRHADRGGRRGVLSATLTTQGRNRRPGCTIYTGTTPLTG